MGLCGMAQEMGGGLNCMAAKARLPGGREVKNRSIWQTPGEEVDVTAALQKRQPLWFDFQNLLPGILLSHKIAAGGG